MVIEIAPRSADKTQVPSTPRMDMHLWGGRFQAIFGIYCFWRASNSVYFTGSVHQMIPGILRPKVVDSSDSA